MKYFFHDKEKLKKVKLPLQKHLKKAIFLFSSNSQTEISEYQNNTTGTN